MTQTQHQETTHLGQQTQPEPGASSFRHEPLRRLAMLAGESLTVDAFAYDAAKLVAEHFVSPACTVAVRHNAQDVLQSHADDDAKHWTRRLEAMLLEVQSQPRAIGRLYQVAESKIAAIAAPIPGEITGAIATLVSVSSRHELETTLTELRAVAATIAAGLVANTTKRSTKGASNEMAASAIQRAGVYTSIEEFAFALTNNLRNKLGAESVAFALPAGARARLVAISGLDEVKPRSPGTIAMRQAIEECLDQQRPLCAQQDDTWQNERVSTGHPLHRAWSASAHGAAVFTVPLFAGDDLTGVVAIRRRADQPVSRDDLDTTIELLAPFGAAVPMVQRATRNVLRHALDSTQGVARAAIRPGAWGIKAIAALTTLALAWFVLGTTPYKINARAIVSPAEQIQISSPYEAAIRQVHARAGDRVQQGQLLATLDTRDLELERSELLAEARALRVKVDSATAARDIPAASVAAAEQRATLARLETVEQRIQAAAIRAPSTGVLIRGDLAERIGQRLPVGEALFTFVPSDALRVEILAPEHAADELMPNLSATFSPEARPEDALLLTIERIDPAASVHEGANVVTSHAVPNSQQHPHWLLPGMEGTASINAGSRPVWWVALHRAIDAAHARFMP